MARILVVEDDALMRDLLQIKLANCGHVVTLADNGRTAYLSLRSNRPDLILLDMMLPVMSGGEVLARLRGNPLCRAIPVIVLSLRGDTGAAIEALRNGASDFLAKPFNPDELMLRIEKQLQMAMVPKSSRFARNAGMAIALGAVPALAAAEEVPMGDPLTLAMVAHDHGLHAQAAASLRKFIALAPDDADLWLRLGLELSHADDLAGAETALAKAVALAPDYVDARDALDRVRKWRAAAALASPATSLNPADTVKTVDPLKQGERKWDATLVHSTSHFDGGSSPDWNTTTGVIDYSFYRRENYFLQVDASKTYGQNDLTITGQAERHLSPSVSAYLGASMGVKARIKPQWALRGGGEVAVLPVVKLGIDTQIARYPTATVGSATPRVSFSLPKDRATLTISWINVWDEHGAHRNGWSLRAEGNVTHSLMLFGGAANYPDTEAGITRRMSARYLGGNYALSDKLTLMFGYDTERNDLGVRRQGGWLGLRIALSARER